MPAVTSDQQKRRPVRLYQLSEATVVTFCALFTTHNFWLLPHWRQQSSTVANMARADAKVLTLEESTTKNLLIHNDFISLFPSHTMISRALKLQQRKTREHTGAPFAMAISHVLFAVSSQMYPILFHLILVSYPSTEPHIFNTCKSELIFNP